MSDNVNVKYWENGFLEISVWSIKYKNEFYFFAKDIAEALGYKDPKAAIQDHVTDSRDKILLEELMGPNFREFLRRNVKSSGGKIPLEDFFLKIRRNYRLLTEFGLYEICSNSRMEKAKPFKRWIFETITKIRKTGSYTLSCGSIENPLDLIAKVSSLEKEIKTLKKEKKTYSNKGTQTPKTINPFELKSRLEKSIRKSREIEMELKKSLKKIGFSPTNSRSSSYSSPPRYSSDSD